MQTAISMDENPARIAGLRRKGQRLWTLLHAQALLAGPAAAAGSVIPAEDDYRRLAGTHSGGYQGRMP
jgi:hypothetical protein